MAKKAIQYAVVDAFAVEPFRGNPAAVCLLEAEDATGDERWMQSVAAEFNLSETAFLTRDSSRAAGAAQRFHLRWFTPVTEVELCGHATLASAYFLFSTVFADHDGMVEFMTKSGILTAKKVPAPGSTAVPGEEQGKLFIELDFPMIDFVDCNSVDEMPSIPNTLNGASVVSVHKSATDGDLIVELSSREEVVDLLPDIDEIRKCAGRGVIVTAPAPAGSGYDIFSRFFCPKFGIDEGFEAEYRGVANAVAECCWLQHLLQELHSGVDKATVVYCHNVSAVYLAVNPVHHKRTKHIELDIHFMREKDPVTGSIHCVLAPYWGRKLGKQKLNAYQASPRGGTLYLELDAANRRVRIQGETVTVMAGTLLA